MNWDLQFKSLVTAESPWKTVIQSWSKKLQILLPTI